MQYIKFAGFHKNLSTTGCKMKGIGQMGHFFPKNATLLSKITD